MYNITKQINEFLVKQYYIVWFTIKSDCSTLIDLHDYMYDILKLIKWRRTRNQHFFDKTKTVPMMRP